MLRFKVFGQEAIDLQQPLASESHVAVIDFQIPGGLLIAERFGEFRQHIDAGNGSAARWPSLSCSTNSRINF
ncbi:MAG: hypothetical protein FD138_3403 [Planctomycetota bacterium]|nr:MAG: hypothetical protein FD138_3403 [Planctomycetota bacterium]